jgi:ribonuclease VapC
VIVDTSALVAVVQKEHGFEVLKRALTIEAGLVPAPVTVEFNLVTSIGQNDPEPEAQAFLKALLSHRQAIASFTDEDAALSAEAHRLYGRGNGRGGKLNMLDVMVYCMAKRLARPILCTGRDFAATDAAIHPASRIG